MSVTYTVYDASVPVFEKSFFSDLIGFPLVLSDTEFTVAVGPYQTSLLGTDFVFALPTEFDDGSFSGTMTGITFKEGSDTVLATLEGVNWDLVAFDTALIGIEAALDFSAMAELFSEQDSTFDLSASINGFDSGTQFFDGLMELVTSSITLLGSEHDDRFVAGQGADTLNGEDGNDTLLGGKGADVIHGHAGDDILFGNQDQDTMVGHLGSDSLDGGTGNDSLSGGAGDDLIMGGDGFDTLRGGGDADTVIGGDGRDLAYLGGGDDLFVDNAQGGINGRDTVFANAGNDTLGGGNGNDVLHGQGGGDQLKGRLGHDKLFGGNQNDTLYGGNGHDTVAGGNGRDRAFLGNGNDSWFDNDQSTFGDDFVKGGSGNDTLRAGGGDDTLGGGGGSDTFIFAAAIDDDSVTDYDVGVDVLQFNATLWNGTLDQARLDALTSVVNGNLVFTFDNGDTLTLSGVTSTTGLLGDISLF